jgi:hypothetical protein
MTDMQIALIVGGCVFVLWVLLHMKLSRCDGTFVKNLHPYRRMMSFLMPSRNGAVVYYDDYVKADKLLQYIEEAREHFHVDVTHCLVAACTHAISHAPTMNRFTVGNRLYDRKGRYITFTMKRQKLNQKAKISAVKTHVPDGFNFRDLASSINQKIGVERSDKVTYTDKELSLFLKLPRPLLRLGINLFKNLDYFNLLPGGFIHPDPMYTSIFVANLGSLGMRAGFHHLYEWGNCPAFMMVGKIEDRPVVEDGKVVVQKTMHIRWTYDERIDDGLTSSYGMAAARKLLEDPYTYLGCIKEDGSDVRAIDLPSEDIPR